MEDGGRWRPRNALAQAGPDVVHVARLLVEVELVDDAFLQLLKEGRAGQHTTPQSSGTDGALGKNSNFPLP